MKNLKKESGKDKHNRGVTLIALVVTIVVLLILASITIANLTSEKGVIKEARTSKEQAEMKSLEEQIEVAIIKVGQKYRNPTMDNIIEELINNNIISDASKVDPETGTIITNLGYEINGKLDNYINMYNIAEKITPSPQELFFCEKTGDKTAKIIGINDQYIDIEMDNYYHINHNGVKDTLVVPYEVTIDGEIYTVTEVDLTTKGKCPENGIDGKKNNFLYAPLPLVKTIIYPNTVTKLSMEKYRETKPGTSGRLSWWAATLYDNNVIEEVILPKNLEEIGDGGIFAGCKNLKKCILPQGIKKIGEYSFWDSGLKSMEIPESVVSIGKEPFCKCSSLTSINIPSSVTSIGDKAFYECRSLTSINLPSGVTSIGNDAFYECSSLTSINIPSSVTSIGNNAFYKCTSLTSINIPRSVTTMGDRIFAGWTYSQTINFERESQPAEGWSNKWEYEWNEAYKYDELIKATIKWNQKMR